MQELGNVLTILGILVTFVAYFGEHSGVTLADLEPGLVKRWRAARVWVLRRLGRDVGILVRPAPTLAFATGGRAVVWSWQSIDEDDDLALRVEKLAHNLEQLRTNLTELRELDVKHFRRSTEAISNRLGDLHRLVNEERQQGRREATSAMRWEVRGLLIALAGAVLSVLG